MLQFLYLSILEDPFVNRKYEILDCGFLIWKKETEKKEFNL